MSLDTVFVILIAAVAAYCAGLLSGCNLERRRWERSAREGRVCEGDAGEYRVCRLWDAPPGRIVPPRGGSGTAPPSNRKARADRE